MRSRLGNRTSPIEVQWPLTQPARGTDDRPLGAEEIARLDGVLRRLHSELRALLGSLPGWPRGASDLSRDLGVDRTICQRVVSVVSGPYSGVDLVSRLPGTKGLSQFLEAVRGRGADAPAADSAEAAVNAFAALIQDLGPSQSRLIRRVEASEGSPAAAPAPESETAREEAVRRGLFECGRHFTGQYTDVSIATFFFRPTPGASNRIDMATVRGFLGHHMKPDAMPFSVLWWVAPPDGSDRRDQSGYETLDRAPVQGKSQGVLLEEYSTQPVPVVTTRGPRERRVVLIDPAGVPEDEGFDVVTANRIDGAQAHPLHDSPPMHEVWVLGRFPAKLLIFDVFLHRSMARECIPSVGAYMMSPNLNETMDRRWLDRFPGGPRLALLEPGPRNAAHEAYGRYPDLLTHMHERLGWSAADFVGYRCEVLYPQWGAGYCMMFDYSRTDGSA